MGTVKYVLDTHIFLWASTAPSNLSAKATAVVASAERQCYLSIASLWEISIKVSKGLLELHTPLETFILQQLTLMKVDLLPVTVAHVIANSGLPHRHKDPFDRMIAAQCLTEQLKLVSTDKVFRKYGVAVVW